MLGSPRLWTGLGLYALSFVLVAAHPQPELQRYRHAFIPKEPDIMELPNGLMDDYGILPKHPRLRVAHPFLSRAQKRKRDGPDLSEYYYDAHP